MSSFRVTGNPDLDLIVCGIGFLVLLYWLRALRLAREGARLFLRNGVVAVLVFGGCLVFLRQRNPTGDGVGVVSAVAAVVVFVLMSKRNRRRRHIPAHVKRAVVKRDLKGVDYDGSKHHIDHVWPFALGGSHTTDNLRVIDKKTNLKKGKKKPQLREMW